MDEDNEENLVNNDQVKIDFCSLFQCIHIHDQLGKLGEFRKNYGEDREAQIDLILTTTLNLDDNLQSLEKLMHEVVGFFVVEHVVIYATQEFRTKANVK